MYIAVTFIGDRLSGCFRAASELHWAELRWLLCSVCVHETLIVPHLSSANLQTCWLGRTPPACEEVHTCPRRLSLRPHKTSPRPRCNTAGGPRCHPEARTQTACLYSSTEVKPAACRDFKNVPESSPDRNQPPRSPVRHRSCFQWWGHCTMWSGYMFSCQWAPPQLPAICSPACLQCIYQHGTWLIKGFWNCH